MRTGPAVLAAEVEEVVEGGAERPDPLTASAGPERRSSTIRLRSARVPSQLEATFEDDGATGAEAVRRTEERLLLAILTCDLASALTVACVLVYMDPDHSIARRLKDRCAKQMYGGSPRAFPRADAVPRQRVPWSELPRRSLSCGEAHVLWCVDGRSTVEQIIDASAMTPLAAFDTLDALACEGLVELG